jgi:SAM-dependent methyltransferase
MKILNPAVVADVAAGTGLRLNLGGGLRRREGFYGVDLLPLPDIDIVADLNQPLDALPDDSVAEVYSRHTLEHVSNLLPLLAELHRVTRPGGRIEVIVPHFSNPYAYSDPTHVRTFGLYTFFYFADADNQPRRKVPNFYLPVRFHVEGVRVTLVRRSLAGKVVAAGLARLVNVSWEALDWYERRLCRAFPAESIRYVLRPLKTAFPSEPEASAKAWTGSSLTLRARTERISP